MQLKTGQWKTLLASFHHLVSAIAWPSKKLLCCIYHVKQSANFQFLPILLTNACSISQSDEKLLYRGAGKYHRNRWENPLSMLAGASIKDRDTLGWVKALIHVCSYSTPTFITEVLSCYLSTTVFNDYYSESMAYIALAYSYWVSFHDIYQC